MTYIVPSKKVKEMLKNAIIKEGGVNNFSKLINDEEYNIRRWRRGTRAIPFRIIKMIADSKNLDLWEFLNKERLKAMTTSNSFRISYKINTYECLLLGWVLSEGHLAKDRVTIAQNERQPLEIIKKSIIDNFSFASNSVKLEQDRGKWRLVIYSSAFSNYLNLRYGVPFGKKSSIISIPKQIFELSNEEKFAFLSGCLEGDGSFTTSLRESRRGKYRIPIISLTSNSKKFLKDINILLSSLEIKSRIHSDKVLISRAEDCVKLFYKIFPFMIHKKKIRNFMRSLADFQFLNAVPIANSGDLIKKWKDSLNVTWAEFTKIVEKNANISQVIILQVIGGITIIPLPFL
jgi:intein/homing endonuclease